MPQARRLLAGLVLSPIVEVARRYHPLFEVLRRRDMAEACRHGQPSLCFRLEVFRLTAKTSQVNTRGITRFRVLLSVRRHWKGLPPWTQKQRKT